jgi:hypothetical protein
MLRQQRALSSEARELSAAGGQQTRTIPIIFVLVIDPTRNRGHPVEQRGRRKR